MINSTLKTIVINTDRCKLTTSMHLKIVYKQINDFIEVYFIMKVKHMSKN